MNIACNLLNLLVKHVNRIPVLHVVESRVQATGTGKRTRRREILGQWAID